MISNEGTYWSTGITVRWLEHAGARTVNGRQVKHAGWGATLDFYDDGFCSDDPDGRAISTQGTLHTRYAVKDGDRVSGLSLAINTLITDAQRLGIQLGGPAQRTPSLYYDTDGENPDYPPPHGWRVLLSAECARLGWDDLYTSV